MDAFSISCVVPQQARVRVAMDRQEPLYSVLGKLRSPIPSVLARKRAISVNPGP